MKNEKLKEAFGIKESYAEGNAFSSEYQAAKRETEKMEKELKRFDNVKKFLTYLFSKRWFVINLYLSIDASFKKEHLHFQHFSNHNEYRLQNISDLTIINNNSKCFLKGLKKEELIVKMFASNHSS